MNEQEKNKLISEILVSQEKQIQVDAIQIVEKNKVEDREEDFEIIKKNLKEQRNRCLSN